MTDCHERVNEWLNAHAAHEHVMQPGNDRSRVVASSLGVMRPAPMVVSVAGTNGKGSVVRGLEALLVNAGLQVGSLSSPHVVDLSERTRIQGDPCGEESMLRALAQVEAARCDADVMLSWYEYHVLATLEVLKQAHCDVVVLEVGLGGRLDTVNVVDADVCVITKIALDHTEILGKTRDAIAFEKAGILRRQCQAVIADRAPPPSLMRQLEDLQCVASFAGKEFDWRYRSNGTARLTTPLGSVTLEANALPAASLAAAATVFHYVWRTLTELPLPPVVGVLAQTRLIGRRQEVSSSRFGDLVIDIAHNPDALRSLATFLRRRSFGPTACVFGCVNDKKVVDHGQVALRGVIEQWFTVATAGPRGQDAATTAALLQRAGEHATPYVSVREALSAAHQCSKTQPVVVCGSAQVAGLALEACQA